MNFKTFLIVFFIFIFVCAGVAAFFWWQAREEAIVLIPSPSALPSESPQTEASISPETSPVLPTATPYRQKGDISRGNFNKKQIIFTFDAGAADNSALKILEVAKNHNIKTTFFLTGRFAEKYPEITKKISQDGHEIFNHTYSHLDLTKISNEEIKSELEKAELAISLQTGKTTKPYFRPPFGARNNNVSAIAKEDGYQLVFWSVDALDWKEGKTPEEVKQKIYSGLKNGSIILMHVGDDITGSVLDEVFTKIENDGYKIVSLTEGLK